LLQNFPRAAWDAATGSGAQFSPVGSGFELFSKLQNFRVQAFVLEWNQLVGVLLLATPRYTAKGENCGSDAQPPWKSRRICCGLF
jgi:hypothetical protein